MLRFLKRFKKKEPLEICVGGTPDPDVMDYTRYPKSAISDEPIEFDDRYNSASYCILCVHSYGLRPKCAAFPTHIPIDIWNGARPHTTPYPGDSGILFEPREGCINPFAPKEEQEKQRQQKE